MDTHYSLNSLSVSKYGQLSELSMPVNASSPNREEQVQLTVVFQPDLSLSLEEIQRLGLQRGIEILQGALDLLNLPPTGSPYAR